MPRARPRVDGPATRERTQRNDVAATPVDVRMGRAGGAGAAGSVSSTHRIDLARGSPLSIPQRCCPRPVARLLRRPAPERIDRSRRMWDALTQSVAVARRVKHAEQLLRGGMISDVLVEFGEVMVTSAREHLVEARTSPDPRRRVEDAAGALQDAYFAFERAHRRGAPVWIRRQLARAARGGCSGSIAGASDAWPDRQPRSLCCERHSASRPTRCARGSTGWPTPVALERVAGERYSDYYSVSPAGPPVYCVQRGGSGDAAVRTHLISYFTLERLLLPSQQTRPLPRAWRQDLDGAVVPRPAAELLELYGPVTWPHYAEAGDEPGPNDLLLMIPSEDVVPPVAAPAD